MHVPGFWFSPWSPSPSIAEPSGQHARTPRKQPRDREGPPVDGACTVGLVDERGHIFILSATPEIFINTTHHPLINCTPAMDAPLIMNAFPIRTKAIDFCHSFEMDLLEGTFSLLSFNPSKQTSTEERKFSGQGQPLGCRRVWFLGGGGLLAYTQVTFKWAPVGCTLAAQPESKRGRSKSLTPSDNGLLLKWCIHVLISLLWRLV